MRFLEPEIDCACAYSNYHAVTFLLTYHSKSEYVQILVAQTHVIKIGILFVFKDVTFLYIFFLSGK